jgi:hypothetical protein
MHEGIASWLCPALVALAPAGRGMCAAGAQRKVLQWRRRAALLLATWGVDVGPRRIHGVRVGAGAVAVAR